MASQHIPGYMVTEIVDLSTVPLAALCMNSAYNSVKMGLFGNFW